MTVLAPEGTPALGNTKVIIVDAVATLTAPDLSSEIGAVTSLEVTGFVERFLMPETVNTGAGPSRLLRGVTFMREGRTQLGLITIRYAYDPQDDDAATANKAKAKLVRGYTGLAVVRKGLPNDTAFAIGDQTETVKIRAGRQVFEEPEEEFGDYMITQNLLVTAEKVHGAIVA